MEDRVASGWSRTDSAPWFGKPEQGHPRYDCASTVAVFRVDTSTGSDGAKSPESESPSYCDKLSPLLASRTPAWSTGSPPRGGELVEETGSWLGAGRVVYSEPQSLSLAVAPSAKTSGDDGLVTTHHSPTPALLAQSSPKLSAVKVQFQTSPVQLPAPSPHAHPRFRASSFVSPAPCLSPTSSWLSAATASCDMRVGDLVGSPVERASRRSPSRSRYNSESSNGTKSDVSDDVYSTALSAGVAAKMSVKGVDDSFPRSSAGALNSRGAAGIRDTMLAGVGVGRLREEQRCLDQELRWLSAREEKGEADAGQHGHGLERHELANLNLTLTLEHLRETLTALGSSIEVAMEGATDDDDDVKPGDDGSKSLDVSPLEVDHASEGNQDTATAGIRGIEGIRAIQAASQSRCPEAPREQSAEGKGSELAMQAPSELDMQESSKPLHKTHMQHELLLPEQALALLERTHPSNASASPKERQKVHHKTNSGASIQRTPSGRFWCQRCKNVIVQKNAERSDACSGTYAFQCCCVCAVEEGWQGWAKSACPQCRAWAEQHAGSARAQAPQRAKTEAREQRRGRHRESTPSPPPALFADPRAEDRRHTSSAAHTTPRTHRKSGESKKSPGLFLTLAATICGGGDKWRASSPEQVQELDAGNLVRAVGQDDSGRLASSRSRHLEKDSRGAGSAEERSRDDGRRAVREGHAVRDAREQDTRTSSRVSEHDRRASAKLQNPQDADKREREHVDEHADQQRLLSRSSLSSSERGALLDRKAAKHEVQHPAFVLSDRDDTSMATPRALPVTSLSRRKGLEVRAREAAAAADPSVAQAADGEDSMWACDWGCGFKASAYEQVVLHEGYCPKLSSTKSSGASPSSPGAGSRSGPESKSGIARGNARDRSLVVLQGRGQTRADLQHRQTSDSARHSRCHSLDRRGEQSEEKCPSPVSQEKWSNDSQTEDEQRWTDRQGSGGDRQRNQTRRRYSSDECSEDAQGSHHNRSGMRKEPAGRRRHATRKARSSSDRDERRSHDGDGRDFLHKAASPVTATGNFMSMSPGGAFSPKKSFKKLGRFIKSLVVSPSPVDRTSAVGTPRSAGQARGVGL